MTECEEGFIRGEVLVHCQKGEGGLIEGESLATLCMRHRCCDDAGEVEEKATKGAI
jgi:hypothetical protein